MAYAIMRTAKLKAPANVSAAASHIERSRPTHNARPGIANKWLIGGPGMYAKAEKVWAQIPKKRSDAVHGIEVVMTASPEAFQGPNALDADSFGQAVTDWAQKEFKGAQILGACMHLDESTPHVQLILIPTDLKADGTLQLNAKKYLGSAQKLSAMQTSFAKHVESFGLERGLKGSKAKHTTIQQFYGAINSQGRVKFTRPEVATPPIILTEKGRAAWANEQTKNIVDNLSGPLSKVKAKASAGVVHERQASQLKRSNSKLSAENAELKRKQKEQADMLRSLPLEQVATALGCYQSKKTQAKDKDQWQTPAGPINIKGPKFFNHETGDGGGGAFDLVMHIHECTYSEALAWLRDEFDPAAAINAAAESARLRAQAEIVKAPAAPFRTPVHIEMHWQRVRDYLTAVRGLAVSLIDKMRKDGWLGADARANAYFIKTEGNKIVAVELKGTGKSTYSGSRGRSSEGVFPVLGGKRKLVVCEAPIDAISYVQLHPDCSAIATGGTGKWRAAMPFLLKHQDEYGSLACASDNDEAGRDMAKNYGIAHEPPPNELHDWNDALKAFQDDPQAFTHANAKEATVEPTKPPYVATWQDEDHNDLAPKP
jgi:hypothetical protein